MESALSIIDCIGDSWDTLCAIKSCLSDPIESVLVSLLISDFVFAKDI